MVEVIVTAAFKRHYKPLQKKYRSLEQDVTDLITALETDPTQERTKQP